jgi:hypothetical protein
MCLTNHKSASNHLMPKTFLMFLDCFESHHKIANHLRDICLKTKNSNRIKNYFFLRKT